MSLLKRNKNKVFILFCLSFLKILELSASSIRCLCALYYNAISSDIRLFIRMTVKDSHIADTPVLRTLCIVAFLAELIKMNILLKLRAVTDKMALYHRCPDRRVSAIL